MNERLAELLLAWEDDELTGAEVDELVKLLEADPAARHAAVDHFALSCAIGEQLRESLHEESVVRELQRMTTPARRASEGRTAAPRSRFGLVCVTVVILLIAAFVAYRFDVHKMLFDKPGDQPVVNIEELRPMVVDTFSDVQIIGSGNATEKATLDLGQSLRTSKNSYATLRYPDGTTIQLRGDSQIKIEPNRSGKHLTLSHGGLFADVTPQPKGAPLVLNPNRHDRVEVIGTRFEFVRDEAESVVRVEKGKVEFGPTQRAVEVTEREESKASSDQRPTAPTAIEPTSIWRGWGNGLRGDYYRWSGFSRVLFTRIDPRIDFHWGKGAPDPSIKQSFAIRWTGEIEAPHSSEFTFYTVAHCGVRLWVNDEQLIDNWMSMGAEEESRPIQLEQGQRYAIKIEYWDRHGDAKMRLLWNNASMSKTVVDQQWLYPAIGDEGETKLKPQN